MSDKDKIAIIKEMISQFYEFHFTSDEQTNAEGFDVMLNCIEIVANHEDDDEEVPDTGCSCGGDCHCGGDCANDKG